LGRQWDWRTMAVMTGRITPAPFTPREREYIRRELDMFFGTLPSVAEGFQLRTWRGGPLAGQPKVPPPVRTTVERGLVEIKIETRVPKVHFSEAGLAALRLLALDRRYMDPQKFAHVRAELGLRRQSNGPSARRGAVYRDHPLDRGMVMYPDAFHQPIHGDALQMRVVLGGRISARIV
jgi:hypothetical protein